MRHKTSVTKPFIIAVLLFFTACNNVKKNKDATDISAEASVGKDTIQPPPPPSGNPPGVEMKATEKKCFTSEGLKYTTSINISIGGTECAGTITSEEMGSGKKETARFSGLLSGEAIIVKFEGKPPVVGDASEWTDNVWTIKKTGKKETLTIIFNAKNYETNKWQLTDYQFEQVDCN